MAGSRGSGGISNFRAQARQTFQLLERRIEYRKRGVCQPSLPVEVQPDPVVGLVCGGGEPFQAGVDAVYVFAAAHARRISRVA